MLFNRIIRSYLNTMNISRYFALMLVEASKVGKDEHLRKVQSDILAQLKHSKIMNWMSITTWALISLFIVGWVGFNYFYGPRFGLPDWFWLTAKTLRGLVKKHKTSSKTNWIYQSNQLKLITKSSNSCLLLIIWIFLFLTNISAGTSLRFSI